MTLSMDKPYNKNSYGEGIYVNLVTVIKAEDISGQTLTFLNNPVDIGIKLTIDVGKEFTPEMFIFGNFEYDMLTGDIIGWGSAFVVQEVFKKLGVQGHLTKDNTIPESALAQLVGKQFYRLSYVSGAKDNGQLKYSDWNIIASLVEGAAFLASKFQKSLTRGYPKNYKPQLLNRQNGYDDDKQNAIYDIF